MEFASILMNNGEFFDGKKIGELTDWIINKFSEEKLSYDEAKIVLKQAEDTMGEFSMVQSRERK